MKCTNCGFEFEEGLFCPECGAKADVAMSDEERENFEKEAAVRDALLEKQKAQKERLEREQIRKEQTQQENKKIESQSKTFSILSLCFGIFALLTCGFLFVPEVLGIVFACCSKKDKKMSGLAKAGLICSIISIVLSVGFVMLGLLGGKSENVGNTENVTEAEVENNTENSRDDLTKQDFAEYMNYSEEELAAKLNVEKNDMGYYPNEDNINFMCMEGKIYAIMIRKEHQADSAYSILGISVGDNKDNLPTTIQKEFSLVNTDSIEGGMRDIYINNSNGYSLSVDYDSAGSIIAVNYVLEAAEIPTSSQTTDVQEEITEEVVEKYQIIPNYTYYSQSTDGIIMYANIAENSDGTLDVEGFAYDYSNNLIEELCFEEKFIYSEENWYTSENGIYEMVISNDSIEIMENWFTEENPELLFSGTFQLISED